MLDDKLRRSQLLRRAGQTGRIVMAARNASEKEAVRFAIGGIVTADYVALRVNPVAFAGIRSGTLRTVLPARCCVYSARRSLDTPQGYEGRGSFR